MSKKNQVILVTVLFGMFFVYACTTTPDIDPNKSTLLDTLHINFSGYPDQNEVPANAVYLGNGKVLVIGVRSPISDSPGENKTEYLLILAKENGDHIWVKTFDNIYPKDAVSLDEDKFMVVFDSTVINDKKQEIYVLAKIMNESQEILESRLLPFKPDSRVRKLTRLSDGSFYALAFNDKEDSTVFHPEFLHFEEHGKILENKWDFNISSFYKMNNGNFLGKRDHKDMREGTKEIICFNENGDELWKGDDFTEKSNFVFMGGALDKEGNYLLSGFDYKLYRPALVKYSNSGEYLWIKGPAEMAKYLTYNLINWKDDTFLVAAQKSLSENKLITTKFWESLAAFIIDSEGNVLESDVRPQYWTMTIGGVLATDTGGLFIGLGGVDRSTYLDQRDIALYSLHRDRIKH